MPSTEMDRLEAKLSESKASYDKIKQFADLLYNQGIELVSQISSKYQTLLDDMNNLRDEQHQLSQDLNAIRLNQKAQQIEELTAENQLLRDNDESALGSFKAEHVTPEPSEASRKRRRMSVPPVKSIAKLSRVEIPARRPSPILHMPENVFPTLGPEVNADEEEYDDDQGDNDQAATVLEELSPSTAAPSLLKPPTPSSAPTTSGQSLHGSLEIPSNVDIVVHKESRVLMLGPDESPHLQDTWRKEGQRLQRHWNKQVEEFDEKNPEWHKLNAKVQGCIRSTLFQAGKCNLTTEDPGLYACKTCWNTDSICVGWDVEEKLLFLRPQLPEARRSVRNPNPGPFDVEMFKSRNPKVLRRDLPKYWL